MLGFQVLDTKETVRTVHDTIYTRFEKAPGLKFYDNGCNLHKTATALDPLYWQDTQFLIDGAHEPCHVACSPAFRRTFFTQRDGTNTQIAEQYHARLERSDLTGSLAHMSQVHFLMSIRLFMFFYNLQSLQLNHPHCSLRTLIEMMQLDRFRTS